MGSYPERNIQADLLTGSTAGFVLSQEQNNTFYMFAVMTRHVPM